MEKANTLTRMPTTTLAKNKLRKIILPDIKDIYTYSSGHCRIKREKKKRSGRENKDSHI